MLRSPLLLLPVLLSVLLLAACGGEAEAATLPETSEVETPAAHSYSPFVLELESTSHEIPFHRISFKDVGMSIEPGADRALAYETLAEALALELSSIDTAPMTPIVRHDESLLDPNSHLACEGGHVYVDVWRAGDAGPYGYSLWSGCGEDDRFAFNASVATTIAEAGHPVAPDLDPLAHEIASSIRLALSTGCFQRHC